MDKLNALDAAPIVQRLLMNLNKMVPPRGRPGANARTHIAETAVNAYQMLRDDTLGAPVDRAFDMARSAGATLARITQVRVLTELEKPRLLGGQLLKNIGIWLCLATEGRIIADTQFRSRHDVEALKETIKPPFDDALEIAANTVDEAAFKAIIELQAAITHYLVETARPLPRMLNYQFADILPSLVVSYKLYDTAERADDIRYENRIIHPAFCPLVGRALSR